MKSFRKFLTEDSILILEGGNSFAIDRETGDVKHHAEKINVKEIGRDRLRKSMLRLFEKLNEIYQSEYKEPIWQDFKTVESGYAFNGSSSHLFDPKISSTDYVKHKGSTGDIDLTVPKEKLKRIFDVLAAYENQDITDEVRYLGQNHAKFYGHQINAVFQLKNPKSNIQVDFEGVDYNENHSPTEFSKFGHNSAWEDIQRGIKGMAHKLLLQNLARALSKMGDVVVLTPSSPSEPADKIKISSSASHAAPTNIAFSVDLGTREKYAPAVDSKGNQVYVNGKPAFRELKTGDSKYHKDIDVIYTMIFKKKPSNNDLKKFHSFTGVLSLLKTHKVSEGMIQNMFKSLIEKDFFGKGAQGYEKNNPEGDKEIKMKIVDLLL